MKECPQISGILWDGTIELSGCVIYQDKGRMTLKVIQGLTGLGCHSNHRPRFCLLGFSGPERSPRVCGRQDHRHGRPK